jgi:hypothetical protein
MNDYIKSPIEQATQDVLQDLNSAITHEYKAHKLPLPEIEFRRIIIGYLFCKPEGDWYRDLGLQVPAYLRRSEEK